MKIYYIVLILLALNLAVIPTSAQMYSYRGTVIYQTELIKIAKGGGNDTPFNWSINIDDQSILRATFNVTFSSPASGVTPGSAQYLLAGIKEDINFTLSTNNEGYEEHISWENSRRAGSSVNGTILDPSRQVIDGAWLRITGNTFNLMLKGILRVSVSESSYSENENSPGVMITNTKELKWPILASAQGTFNNPQSINGFLIPRDIANQDCSKCTGTLGSFVHGNLECAYLDKVSISWDLVRNCEVTGTVTEQLNDKDLPESTKDRINEVLAKLEDSSVDPNVFISATNIKEVTLIKQSDKVLDINNGYMVNLRDLFNEYCEKYGKDKKYLTDIVIMTDKEIVRIIRMFNEYYRREHMLTPGQVRIKDWITDQQQNPGSIYSCYSGI